LFIVYKLFRRFQKRFTLTKQLVKHSAVLVTGCDSGFGKATALRLSSKGITVFAACLGKQGVDALQSKSCIVPFQMDVTKNEMIEDGIKLIKKTLEERGINLWALINNAGVMRLGCIDTIPLKDYELMTEVNFLGAIRVSRACLPLLRQSRGRIINISSVTGILATPYSCVYASTKWGIEGLSDSLRRELYPWGIQVIKVEPSIMKTPLWDHSLKEESKIDPKFEELYGKDFHKKLNKQTKALFENGDNPVKIVDTLEHCVLGRWPESNYCIGWDRAVWQGLGWYLPTCVSDTILWLFSVKPSNISSK